MVKRIGVFTLSLNANFGGIIQTVALSHWLTEQGFETTLLNRRRPLSAAQKLALKLLEHLPFQNVKDVRKREKARKIHLPFIKRHFTNRSKILRSGAAMMQAVETHKLDAVIVGSDQVWRVEYLEPSMVSDFFLGFGQAGAYRRISYAASFGTSGWNFPDLTPEISRLLARFDAVSVREASGVDICRDDLGRADVQHVLDPTLLVTPAFYASICPPPPPRAQGQKTVLCYMLDNPQIRSKVLEELGPDYHEHPLSLSSRVTVPDWIASFRDADFVVTDSFHGMVFSIIFAKPFIAIANEDRGADRFTSLLGLLGLSERLITKTTPERIPALVNTPIDFDPVSARLAELRQASEDYLRRALD